MSTNKYVVSIVIVCMNNLKNLYPCLDSIKKYTFINYETLVVAYLFSKENLEKLKADYSWVTIIESNEIRGFSENNNLALRLAKGKYCFVVNDDTEMQMPVIDRLIETIESLPEDVAIVSPNILNLDGTVQCCGRPFRNWLSFILSQFHININYIIHSPHVNKNGVFQTYNILGAAFLIKTAVFKEINFFNEIYFYCPEDIAVSTILNRKGYKCYVNADTTLFHIGGGTKWSKIMYATEPAAMKGASIFYSDASHIKRKILEISIFLSSLFDFCYYYGRKMIDPNEYYNVKVKAKRNTAKSIFKKITPKEIFICYYKK